MSATMAMQLKRIQQIAVVTFVVMLLHTAEEFATKIWMADPFMVYVSRYFNVSGIVVYEVIQTFALVIILLVFLHSLSSKTFNSLLAALLGFIFVLELLHPINSILIRGYYPGLYTGTILVIISLFYFREVFTFIAKKKSNP